MTDETIFATALEQADPAARAAYLNEACAGAPDRRRRVEGLLSAHEKAGGFLEQPPVPRAGPEHMPTQALGAPEADPGEPDDALTFLTPPQRPDSLGRIGHYEVLEVLGKGGFGIVLRAFDETLQRVVAVKVLAPQLAATSPARKRFVREARSSAKVRHENVVQVYAVEEEPLPYLVMEFIPGETLQQRLDRTGPLETVEVVQLGRQIAEGLAAAHAMGLIHRDIKPSNILIEAGANSSIKITDFGLARAADDASLTQSGVVAGTPMYMAPEQAQDETLDHRADLFSLGSVLYTMCSGRPPFRANSTLAVLKRVAEDTPRPIREIIPETPKWLCDVIGRLHAKKPEDRFASAQEVADLLRRRLAQMQHPENVQALPNAASAAVEKTAPPLEIAAAAPAIRRPRFRVRRWAAAAAVLLLLCAGLGFTEATGVTNVHGSVIRLFSPEGTLEIQVDDPGVSVQIDGSDLVITGAGVKEIRLKPGSYTVEASKDGKPVRPPEVVTVTKDGKQIVRVSRVPPSPDAKAANEEKDPDRRAAEYVLSVRGGIKVNEQDREIAELPRESFRLTGVVFWNADGNEVSVTDAGLAVFKDCKDLTEIKSFRTKFGAAGLANFKDCKNLTSLSLEQTEVTDDGLATFKDCKKLSFLRVTFAPITDAGLVHLKNCKNLTYFCLHGTQVTAKGVEELAKALPRCKIEWNGGVVEPGSKADASEWERSVPAMPAEEQVKAVAARLKDLNPGFGGDVASKIEGGVVTEIGIGGAVTDLSPVRALAGLKVFNCSDGPLSDLSPLKGMKLASLNLTSSLMNDLSPLEGMPLTSLVLVGWPQLRDLSPLKGMPLTSLELGGTLVGDLSPLKGMPLTHLSLDSCGEVTDLSPLKGMPLTALNLHSCGGVTDLSPLKGMPLTYLRLHDGPRVTDLSPLKGMPLTFFSVSSDRLRDLSPLKGLPLTSLSFCHCSQVQDLSPLKDMKLTELFIDDTQVRDLEPLRGMPLARLYANSNEVADLRPLQGMPLETLILTPKNITQGLDVVRGMKSLTVIGANYYEGLPAAEFWARFDKGGFKK